ncbi:MAG: chorismate dehydratase [Planctomycetota bacterium]|jgi:chorismate dehydratase
MWPLGTKHPFGFFWRLQKLDITNGPSVAILIREGKDPLIKVAAVSYFNARPLVEGLRGQPDLEVLDLPPAAAAQALLDGEADVGLVPCVTLLRDPTLTYLPGLCIGADGMVDSVLLYLRKGALESSNKPLKIALDPHSRTSQMLTRIYLERVLGEQRDRVEFSQCSPRELLANPTAAALYDGILVIGDLALKQVPQGEWECVDLAKAWLDETGLPFVFAVWGLRRETLDAHPELTARFRQALDVGMSEIDNIVKDMAAGFGLKADQAKFYLTERIVFHLSERAEQGLNEFLNRCREWERSSDA